MESNNNPVVVVAFIVFFGAIVGYIIYAKLKRKGAAWVGTIIDKKVTESASTPMGDHSDRSGIVISGNRNAINRSYSLRIKNDSGEEFSWPVGEGFYESVKVGDRLTKNPGTETPAKL